MYVVDHMSRYKDGHVIPRLERLGVHFGDQTAVASMEKLARDEHADIQRRIAALQSISLARLPSSVETLLALSVGDTPPELRREALRALTNFDSNQVSASLLEHWTKLPADVRKDVITLLSARKPWAHALIDALQKNVLKREDLNENDVRRLLALKDAELTKKVESIWGKLREQTPAEIEKQLAKFRKQLAELPGDRKLGAAVFEKNCQVCHTLAGKGHQVGPDLTGANRRDVEYLLINILDPNRVVGRDYYSAVAVDKSDAVHTGLLAEDTPQRIVLKGENNKLTTIPRSELGEMKIVEKSLMPEGLPNNMSEKEFRDLIAFLLEDPYLNRGLIAGPFKMALDAEGPIEKAFLAQVDPLKTEGVKWKPFQVGPAGVIDMEKQGVLAPPTDSTAYVYFEVASPRDVKTLLEYAADENVKVWLNGKQVVHRNQSLQPDRTPVELKGGVNKILIKVHNIYGASWVWARLGDPERVLETKEPAGP
jgi:putative heme-binding domain-containing protein